jgi:hypothetical protein
MSRDGSNSSVQAPAHEMRVKPSRALLHPLWIASLVVLAVNDHVLKSAGILPGWLTGKLSDFAGLAVAPLVLAVLTRVRSVRGFVACHVAVGACFVAIKTSTPISHAYERAFHVVNIADPTDLVALPALLSGIVYLLSAAAPSRARLEPAAATVGAVCCLATSPPRPPPCAPDSVQESHGSCLEAFRATLFVANGSRSSTTVAVRVLRKDASVDCQALVHAATMGTIGCELRDDQLAAPTLLTLRPGEVAPIEPRVCSVAVVAPPWQVPAVIARTVDPAARDSLVPYTLPALPHSLQQSILELPRSMPAGGVFVKTEEQAIAGDVAPFVCEETP